ncbi:SGNH/GDSL hydrolase family protein [Actinosynnema sp. CA-248983]
MKLPVLAAAFLVGLAVAAPGVATAEAPARWAALGDSYTAGLFVGVREDEPDGCDRTTGTYPHRIAERLAARVTLANASCGGATIKDVAETGQTPVSPVDAPDGGWPSVETQLKRAGVDQDTRVVTIGVGGNSLPLGSIVFHCLLYGTGQDDNATPCRDKYEAGDAIFDRESIRDKYERIFREYVDMLEVVHDRAPNAKVITVGYPTVFPQDASHCDRSNTTHFAATFKGTDQTASMTRGDIEWLHEVVKELNAIIEDITDLVDYDYTFVDTAGPGHDACRSESVKRVEGICGTAPSFWPTEVVVHQETQATLTCSNGTRATLIHPNAAGHRDTAVKVEMAVREALGVPRG